MKVRNIGVLGLGCALGVANVACDEQAARPVPETTVRMGFSAWPGWFPWQIGEEEGLFARTGGMVELIYYESYTDSIAALANGELDANAQTLNDTLFSVAQGDDQVIVLVNDNSTGNDQCIAREGINTVADLVGKQVAVEFGVVDHFLLLLALRRAQVDPASVTIVNELTDVAAQNFAAGMYDATCVFAPFTTTALARTGSFPLITSRTFPGAIPDYLVMNRGFAEEYPGDVQALVDAWWLIRDFMEDDEARAMEIMVARAGVPEPEYRSYAEGTTLFSLEDNLEALGRPPQPCEQLGADAGTYTECVAYEIAQFLLDDAQLIEEPLTEERLQGVWTDRFVRDHADRNP